MPHGFSMLKEPGRSLVLEELLARRLVLDEEETAKFLGVSVEEVLRLVEEQGLPARKVNKGWRFLLAAVCDWLGTGTTEPAPKRSGKEALLALAGAWKDDPDLEEMVEEIYRKRGRPITEEGDRP